MTMETVNTDELLNVLSHEERRGVVEDLMESNPLRVGSMTAFSEPMASEDELEVTKTSLMHVHLPALAEADIIDWNDDDQAIARGPKFYRAEAMVEAIDLFEGNVRGYQPIPEGVEAE